MADRWKTLLVGCSGGLNLNEDTLTLARNPGGASQLINFEPSIHGGYRRINGFIPFDANIVPGSGTVIGVKIFQNGVLAARNDNVYTSGGSGWTGPINTSARTGAIRYRWTSYNWTGTERVIMVDEVNPAARWDGTTYTLITAAGAPSDPKFVEEFRNHIFYAGHNANKAEVIFSVPNNENDFTSGSGAGAFIVGDEITGLKVFRETLIIFCKHRILRITGSSKANFELKPITYNIGCIEPDSIQELNGDLVFLGPDGIRPLAATERIDDVELANISRNIHPLAVDISVFPVVCSAIVREKNQYRLFYHTATTDEMDCQGILGAIISRTSGEWEWAELLGVKPFSTDSSVINNGEVVIHGGYDGFVYRQERGNDFNGRSIHAVFKTNPIFADDPSLRKTIYKITTYYRLEGNFALRGKLIYDLGTDETLQPDIFVIGQTAGAATYGSAIYGTSAYGAAETPLLNQNVYGSGNIVQVQYTTDSSDSPITIQGFKLEYGLYGRR